MNKLGTTFQTNHKAQIDHFPHVGENDIVNTPYLFHKANDDVSIKCSLMGFIKNNNTMNNTKGIFIANWQYYKLGGGGVAYEIFA